MRLSPLNFAGLIALSRRGPDKHLPAIEVTQWQCPCCQELHLYKDDAEECCSDDADATARCPICGNENVADVYGAADCCLWKDLTPVRRWAVADAVEKGSTWIEALGLHDKILVGAA